MICWQARTAVIGVVVSKQHQGFGISSMTVAQHWIIFIIDIGITMSGVSTAKRLKHAEPQHHDGAGTYHLVVIICFQRQTEQGCDGFCIKVGELFATTE